MAFGLIALWPNGLKLSKQSVSIRGGILMLDCLASYPGLPMCFNVSCAISFDSNWYQVCVMVQGPRHTFDPDELQ